MKDLWNTKERYCVPAIRDLSNKASVSLVLMSLSGRLGINTQYLVAGAVAVSDFNSDHYIDQFFDNDDDLIDFFVNEIVLPTERGNLTEEWLATKAFQRDEDDLFFLDIPFVTEGTCKDICERIANFSEKSEYLISASKVDQILQLL